MKKLENSFNNIYRNIQKRKLIVDEQPYIIEGIKKEIEKTNTEIKKIESYNEIWDQSESKKEFVIETLRRNDTIFKNLYFEFYCPTDTISNHIDLQLNLNESDILDKISFLYLKIDRKKETNKGKIKTEKIFEQYYVPKKENIFRIKNYFKADNQNLVIGFVLKDKFQKPNKNKDKYNVIIEIIRCNSRRTTFIENS